MKCLLIDNLLFSILSPEVHTLILRTSPRHRTLASSLMYGSSAVQSMQVVMYSLVHDATRKARQWLREQQWRAGSGPIQAYPVSLPRDMEHDTVH